MIAGAFGAEQNTGGGVVIAAAERLEGALGTLERVWRERHLTLAMRFSEQEQRTEQLIQTLRVQASHWKSEVEKLSTQISQQHNFQQRAQKAEQELSYQRQRAQQWQEKAESWKEEARRAEEARVAALHKSSNGQVKQMLQDLDSNLEEAIDGLKEVITARANSAEPKDAPKVIGAGR